MNSAKWMGSVEALKLPLTTLRRHTSLYPPLELITVLIKTLNVLKRFVCSRWRRKSRTCNRKKITFNSQFGISTPYPPSLANITWGAGHVITFTSSLWNPVLKIPFCNGNVSQIPYLNSLVDQGVVQRIWAMAFSRTFFTAIGWKLSGKSRLPW